MLEYQDWLEQQAEEQRREERRELVQRFLQHQVRAAEETIVKAALDTAYGPHNFVQTSPSLRDFTGTCFMCGDEIPTGAYCSEKCGKEHEAIIEARPNGIDI